ncbi:MAG TPA: hypothetical protein PLK00_09060, partial [Candidatus Hydrogenedentes bacterium]|nr:hypothetical protein [Candidatus Hydrogenedentota bacterium]
EAVAGATGASAVAGVLAVGASVAAVAGAADSAPAGGSERGHAIAPRTAVVQVRIPIRCGTGALAGHFFIDLG